MPIVTPVNPAAQVTHVNTEPQTTTSMGTETSHEQAATPAESKKPVQQDPRMESLKRREIQLRNYERKIKEREESVRSREVQPPQQVVDTSWEDRLQNDTWNFLAEKGLTYEKLTELALKQNPQSAQFYQLQKQIEELKQGNQKAQEAAVANQKAAEDAALNQMRIDAKFEVNNNSEFETIKALGQSDAVVDWIEDVYRNGNDEYERGTILPMAQAAKDIEEYLVEQGIRMSQLTKVRSKLTSSSSGAETQPTNKSQQISKTLTNSLSQTPSRKTLTEKERVERAKLAFMGQLKG